MTELAVAALEMQISVALIDEQYSRVSDVGIGSDPCWIARHGPSTGTVVVAV